MARLSQTLRASRSRRHYGLREDSPFLLGPGIRLYPGMQIPRYTRGRRIRRYPMPHANHPPTRFTA